MKGDLFCAAFLHLKKLWKIFLVQSDPLTETPINKTIKVLKLLCLGLGGFRHLPVVLGQGCIRRSQQKCQTDKANSACQPFHFPGQALPSWTGKILTKQKYTHLLVRFANTIRNLKFRNFKRSTAKHQLLQVWKKWKITSFGDNSPMPYMESLSSVKAFEAFKSSLKHM